jgi:uncharacterized protein involved in exopolysaccharide biosynthesis
VEFAQVNPLIDNEELNETALGTDRERESKGTGALWLIWRRRRFVGLFAARCTLLVTVVVLIWPNMYESTTSIMPPDTQSSSLATMAAAAGGAARAVPASIAADLLGMKNQGSVYISILHSRNLQDRLVNRFDLRKVYWINRMVDARKKLSDRTSIEEEKKSGVISVKVQDRDRVRARDLATAYVEELNRISAEINTTSAHRERVFVEGRLEQVKADMEKTAVEFSQFSSKNLAIDIKEQAKAMVGAAAVLQGQLIAAQTELEGLEQIYTENNARVRVLRTKVEELKRQLNKMAGDVNPTPPSGKDSTAEKQVYPSIRQLPVLGVEYADLYRQQKVQETVFELLTQQFELAKIQEARELPVVRVLDSADVPERKVSPRRGLIIFVSLILSLLVGSSLVMTREYWNNVNPSNENKILLATVGDHIRDFWKSEHKLRLVWQGTSNLFLKALGGRRNR